MKKILSSKAFIAFASGFVLYILVILPELIGQSGIVLFAGDYVYQVIPFTYHIRDAVYSGALCWDHSTGIGSQFLSTYAFYNLFSPFSLIYLIIPRSLIIYAVPYVTALKFGTGTMTAYFFLRRFMSDGRYAVIGGLLYMFSSFTAYNQLYHFTDVIALFPLLLIALEELCVNKRRGAFALAAAFMMLVNYYFFFGQALFCVIYFLLRFGFGKENSPYKNPFTRFLTVAAEALLGVGISMAFILSVIISLLESGKATGGISASDMLLYDDIFHYLKILQSAFMVPDPYQFISLFPEKESVYPYGTLSASVAAYIPVFGAAGVISWIWAKRKTWQSRLFLICAVMALVPVLNSAFSALNSAYYARWFYMPLLIGVLVSLKALEERISFLPGIIACFAALAALTLWFIFSDPELVYNAGNGKGYINRPETILHLAVTAVNLIILVIITRMKRDKEFLPKLAILSVVGIYSVFGVMMFYNMTLVPDSDKSYYIRAYGLTGAYDDMRTDERVAYSASAYNINQMICTDAVGSFSSLNDPGYAQFLDRSGLALTDAVHIDVSIKSKPLADLLSVKYFYLGSEGMQDKYPVSEPTVNGDYCIYENLHFIPMGFTYDKMISADAYSRIEDSAQKQKIYLKALVTDEPEKFADILTLADEEAQSEISEEEYERLVNDRRAHTCTYVNKTTDGLDARITLERENIVFFSVSYNNAWKAYVDGAQAECYNVNNGMVGVRVPAGTHDVTLRYTVRGFAEGCVITAVSAAAFAGYLLISRRKKKEGTQCP